MYLKISIKYKLQFGFPERHRLDFMIKHTNCRGQLLAPVLFFFFFPPCIDFGVSLSPLISYEIVSNLIFIPTVLHAMLCVQNGFLYP